MQIHSDRFDTVLPKTERFFNSPRTKKAPAWASWKAAWVLGGILFVAILAVNQPHSSSPAGVSPVATPAPPRLPDPKPVHVQFPMPTFSAPRAQLLHIRPIGVFENDVMPDGRILGTTYRGELQSVTQLPRTGGQLGDMWYTRADGHCWVLAPIYAGSQATGWVDP